VALALGGACFACRPPPSFVVDGGAADGVAADASAPPAPACDPELKAYKSACLPLLDDCQGNQVPVPGGGCKEVGVEMCPGGIRGPPDWSCKPVGPPTLCPGGWTVAAVGGCEPILPKRDCTGRTKEAIGHATCQPVGDCGAGRWGKIKPGKGTLFVDGSYVGKSPDGSQAKPFPTLLAAAKAAKQGGHIAVAAGTYTGDLVLDKGLTIEGRCPALVTVAGVKKTFYYVDGAAIRVRARGVQLRGLTVNGPGAGIFVEGGEATLEQIVVEDTGVTGIAVTRGEAVVRDALVTGTHYCGIHATGSTLTLERVTVRDGLAHPDLDYGFGVLAQHDEGQPSQLTVKDCVLKETLDVGLTVLSSSATVARTTIRNTRPFPTSGEHGVGAQVFGVGETSASLALADVEIANNRAVGLVVGGASATAERVTIRGTRAQPSDKLYGFGVEVSPYEGRPSALSLRDALVHDNTTVGILLMGSSATVERTVVSDTQPRPLDLRYGSGVEVGRYGGQPGELTLRDVVVGSNHGRGLGVFGGSATVERTVVKNTQPSASDSAGGVGIVAVLAQQTASSLTTRDVLVCGNRSVGIDVEGSVATVERTVVTGTLSSAADGRFGHGVQVVTVDSQPAVLTARDTVVSGNRYAGIVGSGAEGRLERVAVRDTAPQIAGSQGGAGVVWDDATKLTLLDSVVARNQGMGVRGLSTRLEIQRTVVRDTRPEPIGWGDGIVVSAEGKQGDASANVRDVLIEGSARAGLLLTGASGRVERTVIRKGVLPVALEQGASPELLPSNVFEDNIDDRISFGTGLGPLPPLALPPPPPPPQYPLK
jgi:hypothetical protein